MVQLAATELRAGDTILSPTSGILSRVLEVGRESGFVSLHLERSLGGLRSFLTVRPDRVIQVAPRTPGHVAEDRAGD